MNKKDLERQLSEQFQQSMDSFSGMMAENQARSKALREKLFGGEDKGNANEDQEKKIQQIAQVMRYYPQLIDSVNMFAATLLRRHLEIEKLLATRPDLTLELMDDFETLVKSKIPKDQWPDELKESPNAKGPGAESPV